MWGRAVSSRRGQVQRPWESVQDSPLPLLTAISSVHFSGFLFPQRSHRWGCWQAWGKGRTHAHRAEGVFSNM